MPVREFAMQFTSTPRGAQLARRLSIRRMGEWGWPVMSDVSCAVALLVAELAANAVQHSRTPGRDFHLRLSVEADPVVVRVEVSDACRQEPPRHPYSPTADAESGRGLLLVDILATRWGSAPRDPVGKTVWAELALDPADTVRHVTDLRQ